jgi:hypothetical protein
MHQILEHHLGLQRGKGNRQLTCEQIKNTFEQPECFTEKVFAPYTHNTYVERFECYIAALVLTARSAGWNPGASPSTMSSIAREHKKGKDADNPSV